MNLPTESKERKEIPVVSGVLDYFPLAIAAVARVSYKGNEKHNPGQPLHWARNKSADHIDCVGRHLLDRNQIDPESGETELAHAAWRILAALQLQCEKLKLGNDNCRDGRSLGTQMRDRGVAPDPQKPLCYISGPMRNYVDFNFPAFDAARDLMISKGYEVISPADMDRAADRGKEQSPEVYVKRDVEALLKVKARDGIIVMLPGWTRSRGATAEKAVADWMGIRAIHIAYFCDGPYSDSLYQGTKL